MNKDLQRIAIAEACGWKPEKVSYGNCWTRPTPPLCYAKRPESLPDYLGDLNAMHAAECTLAGNELEDYFDMLARLVPQSLGMFGIAHANAAIRAEAFLRIKGIYP